MRYRILQFCGDGPRSWAVFVAKDVKGKQGIVQFGEASPVVSGVTRIQAAYYRAKLMEDDRLSGKRRVGARWER